MDDGLLKAWLRYMAGGSRGYWLLVLNRRVPSPKNSCLVINEEQASKDFDSWMSAHPLDLAIYQRHWGGDNG